MVVPPCLRSPANSSISLFRFTSASCRRSISVSGSGRKDLLGGYHRVMSSSSTPPAVSLNFASSAVKGSFSYSTVPASLNTVARVEDETLAEDLISDRRSSGNVNGIAGGSSQQYIDASNSAWAAWETLKSSSTPTHVEYISTLRQLSEARDFPRCKALLDEMKVLNMPLDAETFSLVLNSGRRTLRANEIRELFGDIAEYNQRRAFRDSREEGKEASSGAASNGESTNSFRSVFLTEISDIVSEMKSMNLRPTVWFYEELANFLTAINQGGVLINLATAMEKRGELPSTKFYNRMLHCLPRCGLLDRASMLFNRMIVKGNADYYTYLVRASALVYVNQMDAARVILNDMKGKFQLDTVAYNILIKSYLSQGNCEQAVQVFNQMTRDSSIAPNRVTCRTFLSYFYDSANLTHSEPIVSYFSTANFPETLEDYGNVIKFFARYDPPKVLDLFKQFKAMQVSTSSEKNQIYHALLRVLNDRQVTMDWKKTFSNLVLESENSNSEASSSSNATKSSSLNCPDLPYQFRMIIDRIESPDSVTYEIVLKKLIQLRRFDSVKALYQSMFSGENPHNVSVQPVHRNLNLTALIMSESLPEAREFLSEMHNRRIPISGKNTLLLEEANIEIPRGALTVKKGHGVTANFNRKRPEHQQQQQQKPQYQQQQNQLNLNII